MPHGQLDYGMYGKTETIFGLSDMGELAARLASLVTFDRRGNVIWLDDFSSDLNKWHIDLYGTGAAAVVSAEHPYSGGFSAKLTTGSDGDKNVAMYHWEPRSPPGKFGFEYAFALQHDLGIPEIRIRDQDGAYIYEYAVRYYAAFHKLDYLDSAGNWAELASDVYVYADRWQYNHTKLVADVATGKYVRFIFNDNTYDLSGISPFQEGPFVPKFLTFGIRLRAHGAANEVGYFDNTIITQNEP